MRMSRRALLMRRRSSASPHIVVISVDRDDLEDGGAGHFAETIGPSVRNARRPPSKSSRRISSARTARLRQVGGAKPDVLNHNLETVPSQYLTVRPGARYFILSVCCSG